MVRSMAHQTSNSNAATELNADDPSPVAIPVFLSPPSLAESGAHPSPPTSPRGLAPTLPPAAPHPTLR
eukprot:CAMPEP_0171870390 /NCGR_PEP_ID=MMETSP0992-20121227/32599_1 /TAXON_ID=483369 /ORGANISM="non described non described, Strain CCMP2098" /LENGTH=67 /DNA_ID=CAMNT_0012494493 /DNA_START=195 /DNA_END=394 /DNA_ORIENTATION=+